MPKDFKDLSEREILALAISPEEEELLETSQIKCPHRSSCQLATGITASAISRSPISTDLVFASRLFAYLKL
jgi:hypothetical protein